MGSRAAGACAAATAATYFGGHSGRRKMTFWIFHESLGHPIRLAFLGRIIPTDIIDMHFIKRWINQQIPTQETTLANIRRRRTLGQTNVEIT